MLVLSVLSLVVGSAAQAEKVWTGALNGTWDTATANWLAGETAATFTAGDDATFTDAATAKTVTAPAAALNVGALVFTNDTDYVLAGGNAKQTDKATVGLTGVTRFEKWGTGKLAVTGYHSFTGDILVAQGELTSQGAPKGDLLNARNSPFGDPRVARTITVLTNGTLSLVNQGLTGGGNSTQGVKMALEVHGGTVNFCPNWMNTIGPAWFDDATITYSYGASGVWRSLGFYGDTRFSGTTPYVFPFYQVDSSDARCGLHLGHGHVVPTKLTIDDITGDDDPDVTFALPICHIDRGGYYGSSGAFSKYGAGTLRLGSYRNTLTGDVHVVEGTLQMAGNQASINATYSCFGNPKVPHTVYVEPGAKLVLTASDLQGQFYNDSKVTLHVRGGTLEQKNWIVNGFGPVILENATLAYEGRSAQHYYTVTDGGATTNWIYQWWPTLGFHGGVTFKGTNTYTLAGGGSSGLSFGANGMSDICVEDITGNSDVDVTFDVQIQDGAMWCGHVNGCITVTNQAARCATWRKTGAGTLKLGHGQSPFTGDVEIREGVVTLANIGAVETPGPTPLGDFSVSNRTITVCGTGVLDIPYTDTFGQLACGANCAFVISNGTVRLGAKTSNGIPRTMWYDGTLEYSGVNGGYGTLAFNGTQTFAGTRPYVFPEGDGAVFWLGWTTDFRTELTSATASNICGKTEFCVADITGDGAADVTFNVPLRNRQTWWNAQVYKGATFKGGLLKTGAGTLALGAASSYTEPTVVRAGALLVNAALSASAVTVEDGARLGGTGTVSQTVTLQTGAGFTAAPGQTQPLALNGSVTLPTDGVVALDIVYTNDIRAVTAYEVPVARHAALAGATWAVAFNGGEPPRGYRAFGVVRNGIVYGRVGRSGCTVFIR